MRLRAGVDLFTDWRKSSSCQAKSHLSGPVDAWRSPPRSLGGARSPIAGRTLHQIFQNSIQSLAVLGGVHDGVEDTYGEPSPARRFGLGKRLTGSMARYRVDGAIYQVKADGVAYPVTDGQRTPFARCCFSAHVAQGLSGPSRLRAIPDAGRGPDGRA